jgi:hypothetical protein
MPYLLDDEHAVRLHPGSGADAHTRSNEVAVSRAPWGRDRFLCTWEGPYAEGVLNVGPKERERRLAEQRVDRSHRRTGGRRQRRPPPWTLGEKVVLDLSLAFIFAGVVLAVVLVVLPT